MVNDTPPPPEFFGLSWINTKYPPPELSTTKYSKSVSAFSKPVLELDPLG
jgi:hypothetical protein